MGKKRFVEDLTEGELFHDLLMVKRARLGETRAGKPYLVLTLGDRSGEISGPVWEKAEAYQKTYVPGVVAQVKAVVQTYNDKLQLRIDTLSVADERSYKSDDLSPPLIAEEKRCRES